MLFGGWYLAMDALESFWPASDVLPGIYPRNEEPLPAKPVNLRSSGNLPGSRVESFAILLWLALLMTVLWICRTELD
jgi:hypothetical protein